MKTNRLDIVYCLKENTTSEELRYSLRSLKNMPHRRVWIYGGCPSWVKQDEVNWVHIEQNGETKWVNSTDLLIEACKNDKITSSFIWFNDDFFVMKPCDDLDYFYDRTLEERADDFKKESLMGNTSMYGHMLLNVAEALKENGKDTKSYALHIPIIFNRKKFLKMADKYKGVIPGRSTYCNEYEVGGKEREDVKLYSVWSWPNPNIDFLSTTNGSFDRGYVGKFIRYILNEKSKYEL